MRPQSESRSGGGTRLGAGGTLISVEVGTDNLNGADKRLVLPHLVCHVLHRIQQHEDARYVV
jgi:hypothetical protein